MRFHWGPYKNGDYAPYFTMKFGFICLPLLFGNLYIMNGNINRPWNHPKFPNGRNFL